MAANNSITFKQRSSSFVTVTAATVGNKDPQRHESNVSKGDQAGISNHSGAHLNQHVEEKEDGTEHLHYNETWKHTGRGWLQIPDTEILLYMLSYVVIGVI